MINDATPEQLRGGTTGNLFLCLMVVSVLVFMALGCLERVATRGPSAEPPALVGVTDPLSRAETRQEFIKELAPDNAPVVKQADATIADVGDAREGVAAARSEMKATIDKLEAEKASLAEQLARAIGSSERWYRNAVLGLRLLCIGGIAGGLIASVLCRESRLVIITLASVATLAAIAVEGFTWKYAMPIGAVALSLGAAIGLWWLWQHRRGFGPTPKARRKPKP